MPSPTDTEIENAYRRWMHMNSSWSETPEAGVQRALRKANRQTSARELIGLGFARLTRTILMILAAFFSMNQRYSAGGA